MDIPDLTSSIESECGGYVVAQPFFGDDDEAHETESAEELSSAGQEAKLTTSGDLFVSPEVREKGKKKNKNKNNKKRKPSPV